MNVADLFKQKELSVKESLGLLLDNYDNFKFLDRVYKVFQYSDEPKFFQYASEFKDISSKTDGNIRSNRKAGGSSFFSEELALLKCLGETVERYSCTVYRSKNLIKGTFASLEGKALDLKSIVAFSENQRKHSYFDKFNFSESTPFTWVKGQSLISGKQILLPAQMIYYSYKFSKKERMIYVPISTGAAGGSCLASALVRGILEIVERDAFMISYLNQLHSPRVDLSKIKDIRVDYLKNVAKRYRLEWSVIDMTNDLEIPAIASVVIDKSGYGPAVLVGLKANLNPIDAIIGSFEEAINIRGWMRHTYEDDFEKYKNLNPKHIHNVEQRGMYWFPKKMIKQLDFWLENNLDFNIDRYKYFGKTMSHGKLLKILFSNLRKKGFDVFFTEVTVPEIKKLQYRVVKVIIPQLQPFYQSEYYPYLGGERLFKYSNGGSYNNVPHPFL
ncbi:MAG: YcaO-like family protein [Bacteroidota bacterium]